MEDHEQHRHHPVTPHVHEDGMSEKEVRQMVSLLNTLGRAFSRWIRGKRVCSEVVFQGIEQFLAAVVADGLKVGAIPQENWETVIEDVVSNIDAMLRCELNLDDPPPVNILEIPPHGRN